MQWFHSCLVLKKNMNNVSLALFTHKYHGLLSFPQGEAPETFPVDVGIDSCLYGKRAGALPKHIFVFMRHFMFGDEKPRDKIYSGTIS